MKEIYGAHIAANENVLKMMFGQAESQICNETPRFEDYDKVVFSYFDPEERGGSGTGRSSRRTASVHLNWGHGWQRTAGNRSNDKMAGCRSLPGHTRDKPRIF